MYVSTGRYKWDHWEKQKGMCCVSMTQSLVDRAQHVGYTQKPCRSLLAIWVLYCTKPVHKIPPPQNSIGKSKEQAMEEYITKVEQLKEKYCS